MSVAAGGSGGTIDDAIQADQRRLSGAGAAGAAAARDPSGSASAAGRQLSRAAIGRNATPTCVPLPSSQSIIDLNNKLSRMSVSGWQIAAAVVVGFFGALAGLITSPFAGLTVWRDTWKFVKDNSSTDAAKNEAIRELATRLTMSSTIVSQELLLLTQDAASTLIYQSLEHSISRNNLEPSFLRSYMELVEERNKIIRDFKIHQTTYSTAMRNPVDSERRRAAETKYEESLKEINSRFAENKKKADEFELSLLETPSVEQPTGVKQALPVEEPIGSVIDDIDNNLREIISLKNEIKGIDPNRSFDDELKAIVLRMVSLKHKIKTLPGKGISSSGNQSNNINMKTLRQTAGDLRDEALTLKGRITSQLRQLRSVEPSVGAASTKMQSAVKPVLTSAKSAAAPGSTFGTGTVQFTIAKKTTSPSAGGSEVPGAVMPREAQVAPAGVVPPVPTPSVAAPISPTGSSRAPGATAEVSTASGGAQAGPTRVDAIQQVAARAVSAAPSAGRLPPASRGAGGVRQALPSKAVRKGIIAEHQRMKKAREAAAQLAGNLASPLSVSQETSLPPVIPLSALPPHTAATIAAANRAAYLLATQ